MDSPTAAHRARERLITDRSNKISSYCVANGGNWLGQVLKSMCSVVHANFDPQNSIQMRKRVVQDYLDFVADPDFGPIAAKDRAFQAVLAFAEIFGAYVDEMNERTVEGQSMTSRAVSFGDAAAIPGEVRSNRAASSPAVVGDDYFPRLRLAWGGQGDHDDEDMTPSLGLVRSSGGRFAGRSSITATPRMSAVDNDGHSGARKRARGDKLIAVSPLTPSNHQVGQKRLPVPRRRSSNEATFDFTASSVVVCTMCGEKVKEGSMRRHMKGHAAGIGGEAAAVEEPASLLDEIDTSSEEAGRGAAAEDEGAPHPPLMLSMAQNLVLNEFGLEEESADEEEMEVEEGGKVAHPTSRDLDGWAANLRNKPAICFICNKMCANYKLLSTHLYGSHKFSSLQLFAFKCLGCSQKFRSFSGAFGHAQAAFRNQQVGCKNKMTFATAAMIAEEDPEPGTPAAREAMVEDAPSPTL